MNSEIDSALFQKALQRYDATESRALIILGIFLLYFFVIFGPASEYQRAENFEFVERDIRNYLTKAASTVYKVGRRFEFDIFKLRRDYNDAAAIYKKRGRDEFFISVGATRRQTADSWRRIQKQFDEQISSLILQTNEATHISSIIGASWSEYAESLKRIRQTVQNIRFPYLDEDLEPEENSRQISEKRLIDRLVSDHSKFSIKLEDDGDKIIDKIDGFVQKSRESGESLQVSYNDVLELLSTVLEIFWSARNEC